MSLTLFTLNRYCVESLNSCLAIMQKQDGLLLIEDGVYLAVDGKIQWQPGVDSPGLYILGEDLFARGLMERLENSAFRIVDYRGFVNLTLEYKKVISW